jgi:hypothetical protein
VLNLRETPFLTSASRGTSSVSSAAGTVLLTTCLLVVQVIFTSACRASQHTEFHGSILQEKGTVRLMLIDASTAQPIANANIQAGEAVVCRKAPCPLATLWTHKSDARGVVQLPRNVVTNHMLIGAEKHAPREIEVAFWSADKRIWQVKLIPNPAWMCSQPGTPWTVVVAGDGQSVEIKKDGRSSEYGVLRCSPQSFQEFFRTCDEDDIYDAGYRTLFSHNAGGLLIRLETESIKGPTDQASLACVPIGK